MARTRSGKERFKRCRGSLCHNRIASPSSDTLWITVSHVLKYSRNWVTIPSSKLHTCTQYTFNPFHPSTITRSPIHLMLRGLNLNSICLDRSPVSMRIMWLQWGGPWNHHSSSEDVTKSLAAISVWLLARAL